MSVVENSDEGLASWSILMPASLAILMMAAARFFTVLESPNVVKEKATSVPSLA